MIWIKIFNVFYIRLKLCREFMNHCSYLNDTYFNRHRIYTMLRVLHNYLLTRSQIFWQAFFVPLSKFHKITFNSDCYKLSFPSKIKKVKNRLTKKMNEMNNSKTFHLLINDFNFFRKGERATAERNWYFCYLFLLPLHPIGGSLKYSLIIHQATAKTRDKRKMKASQDFKMKDEEEVLVNI